MDVCGTCVGAGAGHFECGTLKRSGKISLERHGFCGRFVLDASEACSSPNWKFANKIPYPIHVLQHTIGTKVEIKFHLESLSFWIEIKLSFQTRKDSNRGVILGSFSAEWHTKQKNRKEIVSETNLTSPETLKSNSLTWLEDSGNYGQATRFLTKELPNANVATTRSACVFKAQDPRFAEQWFACFSLVKHHRLPGLRFHTCSIWICPYLQRWSKSF